MDKLPPEADIRTGDVFLWQSFDKKTKILLTSVKDKKGRVQFYSNSIRPFGWSYHTITMQSNTYVGNIFDMFKKLEETL